MKKVRLTLEEMRNNRRITPSQAAAFIGITVSSYRDLELHNDEPWSLCIMGLMRLCLLYETPPETLLPEDAFLDGKKKVQFVEDQYGTLTIASTIRGYWEDVSSITQEINWEEDSINLWISDEVVIGTMPLLALNDLCRYLNISILDVLEGFWAALGRLPVTGP